MEMPSQLKGEGASDLAEAQESAAKVGGNYETCENDILPVTVDPVTSKKAPQSGRQRERESARSATNSESRPDSGRKDSRASHRSPGHHAT